MKRLLTLPVLLATAVLAVLVSAPFLDIFSAPDRTVVFEVKVASPQGGSVQLYIDRGAGFNEADSVRWPMPPSAALTTYQFPIGTGRVQALRFDPVDRPGPVTLASFRVIDAHEKTLRTFAPQDFAPANQIGDFKISGGEVHLLSVGNDPILTVRLAEPLEFSFPWIDTILSTALRIGAVFFVLLLVILAVDRTFEKLGPSVGPKIKTWWKAKPTRALAIAAAVAAIASSYPVVFLGKSFVGPNFNDGTFLLYGEFPTLPKQHDRTTENAHGSDVGAIIWQHVPISMAQQRALFRDGELPLWMRASSSGNVMLAQSQTMFGELLHFFVIFAGGAAWAWDLHYLAAKFLFGFGLGLIVWRTARHLPSALLIAGTSAFIGFFVYRVNHPAFFSLCYAPWILYAWIGLAEAVSVRAITWWSGALLLANWSELFSGTAKEAFVLILTMNASGLAALLVFSGSLRARIGKIAAAALAGLILVLVSAPLWLPFVEVLRTAYTSYNDPKAYQILPTFALGFFDEIFYRPIQQEQRVFNPSVNFLILLGVAYALVTWRRFAHGRVIGVLALAAVACAAFAFGVIPPAWIIHLPFLANALRIDDCFSCALVVLAGVLAGSGFKAAAERLGHPEGRSDALAAGSVILVLAVTWVAQTHTVHRVMYGENATYTPLHWGEHLQLSPFIWASLAVLLIAVAALVFAARSMLRRGTFSAAWVIISLAALLAILWRHGAQALPGFKAYTFSPPSRADFHAPSRALEAMRTDAAGEPSRAVGLGENLFPGWNVGCDVESISGPDAVANARYRELLDVLGLQRVNDWRILVNFDNLGPLRRAYDLLNVRYYFDLRSDQARLGHVLTAVKMADLDVYRSESAWPRAFFTDRLATYSSAAEFARLVSEGDGRPFAAAQNNDVYAPHPLSLDHGLAGRTVVFARHYTLTTNTTAFDIDTPRSGIVVLDETFSAGDFQVELDDKPVPCFRVNHAFKGILVDSPGTHHVMFRYWPNHFTLALSVAAVGVLLGIGAFAGGLRMSVSDKKTIGQVAAPMSSA